MKTKHLVVIGAGYGGLSAAALLAHKGYKVTVLEKHNQPGGRARLLEDKGFKFDIGPSWYMMPEMFDRLFSLTNKNREDYYKIKRLDPSYRIFFNQNDSIDIPSNADQVGDLFETLEKGSKQELERYLADAKYKYDMATKEFLYKRFSSIFSLLDRNLVLDPAGYDILKNFHKHTKKYFKNDRIIKIMEWMITFLGSSPYNAPAIYSLIAHAEFNLGIWYPEGGLISVSNGLAKLAEDCGAVIKLNSEVLKINCKDSKAVSVTTNKETIPADAIIANSEYSFTEMNLLDEQHRTYDKYYWEKKTYSPSSLLFYVGLNKKLKTVIHHNLYLDEESDWEGHFDSLYKNKRWPENPMFYLSVTSCSDKTVAPKENENLVFLIPIAPGIEDTPEVREHYFNNLIDRFEKINGESIRDHIVVKHSYAINDFVRDYGAFKGNAFGMAHTLFQTANFRPDIRSKKVKNLFYTGCMTQPGIGTPLSIVSAEVAVKELNKNIS